MRRLLRRLRGMFGLGALWSAVWAPIGVGIVVVQAVARGSGVPTWGILGSMLLAGARNGFLAGFLFAGGLALAYRSRTFADLRPGVIGVIGAVAGMILPAVALVTAAASGYVALWSGTVVVALAFGGALGAATAVGAFRMAQAAPPELESGPSSRALESPRAGTAAAAEP